MRQSAAHAARWLLLGCLFAHPLVGAASAQTIDAATLGAVENAEPAPEEPAELHVVTVRRGDTLAQLLSGAGLPGTEAAPVLAALTEIFPARELQPGQSLTLRMDPEQQETLLRLDLEASPGRVIRVTREPDRWNAEEVLAEENRHLVLARGEVRGALISSLQAAGLPAPLAAGLIRALAHEIDFQRDLHPGDSFTILFERFRDDGGDLLRNGEIVHAEFMLAGRRLSLWRHETEDGADWFDDQGRSFRRAFLRTPLDGGRISSGFGMRQHPILGFSRMHHGIDFAAPTGTPVYAAADGVVVEAGRRGGYGRMIRLRHGGDIHTLYAHLSRFAPGLKAGKRVRQGEVIGRVGSTGASTGPHLHYEIHMAEKPVDPSNAVTHARVQLAGKELEAFLKARGALQTRLARLAPMEEVAWAD